MALVKSALLIDGENLVFRYQEMLKEGRRIPKKDNVHIPDTFIWNPNVSRKLEIDIFRAIFYTSVVGDDQKLLEIKDKIALNVVNTSLSGAGNYYGNCQLLPYVFKKARKSDKSRLVDIYISVDGMKYAQLAGVECIVFLSGDSDFIKPYEEIMSLGKKVYVGAFSSGLGKNITHKVDVFFELDDIFFEKQST